MQWTSTDENGFTFRMQGAMLKKRMLALRIDQKLIDTIRTWIAQGAPKDKAQAEVLAVRREKARADADKKAKAWLQP